MNYKVLRDIHVFSMSKSVLCFAFNSNFTKKIQICYLQQTNCGAILYLALLWLNSSTTKRLNE
ncbi:hypothetical protein BpHYR1_007829 [Brachionus plicatilis]|uniref:Uncharacterized protein n=1 Tax=Brachionus plicatilis TaxID=10195 RepID=A0A3M7T4U6_BRAPC|nr:hypothetical protein BpHYR1_007829 [Brachionus plicatilis]